MSQRQEIKEGSAEWHVLNDASLMEFLRTSGNTIFDIREKEWPVYLSASGTTVDLENIQYKKNPAKTADKLQQEIRAKQRYLKELKEIQKKIEDEYRQGLRIKKEINVETDLLRNEIRNHDPDAVKVNLQQLQEQENNIQNNISQLALASNDLKNEKMKFVSEVGQLNFQMEKERDRIKLQHQKDRMNFLRRAINDLELKDQKMTKNLKEMSNNANRIHNSAINLKTVEKRNDLNQDRFQEYIQKSNYIDKKNNEIKEQRTSIDRKIKLAETTLARLKDRMAKIQNIKIVK